MYVCAFTVTSPLISLFTVLLDEANISVMHILMSMQCNIIFGSLLPPTTYISWTKEDTKKESKKRKELLEDYYTRLLLSSS